MFDKVISSLRGVSRFAALLCGYLLLVLAISLSIEIVCRKIFIISLQGIDDLGGYVLAISTSVGASYALINRVHTRVDVLINIIPVNMQRLLNCFAMICMAVFVNFTTWRCYIVLSESIEFLSVATNPLQTPLWQPQGIWFLGMLLFAIVATVLALHSLVMLITNEPGLNIKYGVPGAKSDAKGEF